jgi:hypothetical protein
MEVPEILSSMISIFPGSGQRTFAGIKEAGDKDR